MGKVAIDFKINNTHNNTGQLLIFIYLSITSYPSLFVAVFLIRQFVCSAPSWKCSLSVFFTDHKSSCIFTILYFLFLLILLVLSVRQTCFVENQPRSIEATCASWPVQLRLASRCWLLPVCTQWSVRQRNRRNGEINDYL